MDRINIEKVVTFKDLEFKPHPYSPFGGVMSSVELPDDRFISVVGGGTGLYGDGLNTFEIMASNMDGDVIGYLTEEEITR